MLQIIVFGCVEPFLFRKSQHTLILDMSKKTNVLQQ